MKKLFESILKESNMKKVSACVIIYDRENRTFLAEHSTGMKWKGNNLWGLPKGEIDPGESTDETAVREVKEECGIDLNKEDLIYLGKFPYVKTKDLEMFFIEKQIDPKLCKCTSYFDRNGEKLPEVNGFRNISIDSIEEELILSQKIVFQQIIETNPDLF